LKETVRQGEDGSAVFMFYARTRWSSAAGMKSASAVLEQGGVYDPDSLIWVSIEK